MDYMADIDRNRLAQVMAKAAVGNDTAAIALYQEFGLSIARSMRRHLADFGVRDIDPDDLHGLTMDACFVLYDHAGGWSPDGGALPWVWAERRLRTLVSGYIGQWSDTLDDAVHALAAPPDVPDADDPDELELLHHLAATRPDVARYADALATSATSERNQRVLLAYRLQSSLGDRSPAITIGRRFDMTPAAVRQAVKRTGDRLAATWSRPTSSDSVEQIAA